MPNTITNEDRQAFWCELTEADSRRGGQLGLANLTQPTERGAWEHRTLSKNISTFFVIRGDHVQIELYVAGEEKDWNLSVLHGLRQYDISLQAIRNGGMVDYQELPDSNSTRLRIVWQDLSNEKRHWSKVIEKFVDTMPIFENMLSAMVFKVVNEI